MLAVTRKSWPYRNVSAGGETQARAPTGETHFGPSLLLAEHHGLWQRANGDTNPISAGVYPRIDRGLQDHSLRRR